MRTLAVALGMAAASIPVALISHAPADGSAGHISSGYGAAGANNALGGIGRSYRIRASAHESRNPADCDEFLFVGVDRSAYSQCIADLGPIVGDPAPPIHHLVDPEQQPKIRNACKPGAEAPKCAE
jgi:hypothetical protein